MALLDFEPQRAPHRRGGWLDVVSQTHGAHERNRLLALGSREVTIPLLTLLADIDGVEKVRARASDAFVTDGAEVRDGNALDRRLLQEKVADGVCVALAKLSNCLRVGLDSRRSQVSSCGKRWASAAGSSPDRSRAQRSNSGLISMRIIAASRPCSHCPPQHL